MFPLPDTLDELRTAEVVTGDMLRGELPFHHHLGGDAGMVGAGLPEGVVAAHAVIAGEGIHQCVLEGVAHVQAACDIRRRDHDAVGSTRAGRRKIALPLPGFIPVLLYAVWIVGLVHMHSIPARPARPKLVIIYLMVCDLPGPRACPLPCRATLKTHAG